VIRDEVPVPQGGPHDPTAAHTWRLLVAHGRPADRDRTHPGDPSVPGAESGTDIVEPVPDIDEGVLPPAPEKDVGGPRARAVGIDRCLWQGHPPSAGRRLYDQLLVAKVDCVAGAFCGRRSLYVRPQVASHGARNTAPDAEGHAGAPAALQFAHRRLRNSRRIRDRLLRPSRPVAGLAHRAAEGARERVRPLVCRDLLAGSPDPRSSARWHISTSVAAGG
jgi:hypothetical protein